ncbi:hypothetical protein NEMBOFW57_001843 [Staphylotrichum longicolle]|uniref:A to I editase domain-containing protein n=1 Tax=Staphylotrichum longicolle TaxID=669026 RepID=A0AAD4F285_9PEZI|nr:hypothetical protein NEMBOFW57_001843 [Staphylotrichum longicolle]
MMSEADSIALAVLEEFRKLPAKRKPAVRDNGLREWVPLSGIVVKGPSVLKCVALATGMKCLPASKLSQANGVALHDWHAEVLTLRAFNRFILDECRRLAQDDAAESDFLRRRTKDELFSSSTSQPSSWNRQPFAWRDGLTLHIKTPPPGTCPPPLPRLPPHPLRPPNPSLTAQTNPHHHPPLLGRGHFTHLGIVRRKPARGDAPPTHSKSCSDKLALKQCASLLASLAALFVSPRGVYLTTLVLPESQYSARACRRCFSAAADSGDGGDGGDGGSSNGEEGDRDGEKGSGGDGGGMGEGEGAGEGARRGRMAPVRGKMWEGSGYGFHPFRVEVTGREFEFSRRGIVGGGEGEEIKVAASNLAVAWTRDGEVEEGLIGGVMQGRKAFDLKGASATSRRRMWAAAADVAALLGDEGISRELGNGTYDGVKEGKLLAARRRVKEEVRGQALKGWLRNVGDGSFSL